MSKLKRFDDIKINIPMWKCKRKR